MLLNAQISHLHTVYAKLGNLVDHSKEEIVDAFCQNQPIIHETDEGGDNEDIVRLMSDGDIVVQTVSGYNRFSDIEKMNAYIEKYTAKRE